MMIISSLSVQQTIPSIILTRQNIYNAHKTCLMLYNCRFLVDERVAMKLFSIFTISDLIEF